jgi:hypothetical protein
MTMKQLGAMSDWNFGNLSTSLKLKNLGVLGSTSKKQAMWQVSISALG